MLQVAQERDGTHNSFFRLDCKKNNVLPLKNDLSLGKKVYNQEEVWNKIMQGWVNAS